MPFTSKYLQRFIRIAKLRGKLFIALVNKPLHGNQTNKNPLVNALIKYAKQLGINNTNNKAVFLTIAGVVRCNNNETVDWYLIFTSEIIEIAIT